MKKQVEDALLKTANAYAVLKTDAETPALRQ
jgi:hypothetical protein